MNETIKDWILFCEGTKKFDSFYFHTLFWEDITPNNLISIFKYFPNSEELFNLTNDYLFGEYQKSNVTTKLLIDLAISDLEEKKKLISSDMKLMNLLSNLIVEFVSDYKIVEKSQSEIFYSNFQSTISDILFDNWVSEDKKMYALYEAFYGLTKDYQIVWHLFSPLLKVNVDFENYIKLFCAGGIYSISDNKLIVAKRNL